MQIPVLIESSPDGGFLARGGEPFAVVATGSTPEAALSGFQSCVAAKLREGAKLTALDVNTIEHPWLPFAGMFDQSDAVVAEWLDELHDSRTGVGERE